MPGKRWGAACTTLCIWFCIYGQLVSGVLELLFGGTWDGIRARFIARSAARVTAKRKITGKKSDDGREILKVLTSKNQFR